MQITCKPPDSPKRLTSASCNTGLMLHSVPGTALTTTTASDLCPSSRRVARLQLNMHDGIDGREKSTWRGP